MIGRTSLRLRALAATAAFGAPLAFAACSLAPFAEPSSTSTSGSTGTGGSGGTTTGSGGTTTDSTGVGGAVTSSGQGGTGGASTTGSGGSGAGTTTGSGGSGAGTTTGSGGSGGASSTTGSGGLGGEGTTTGSGGASTSTSTTGVGGAMLDGGVDDGGDGGMCGAVEALFPLEPGIHVASCTPLTWATNPPTSGMHYPIWAAFKTYTTPVPRGFYLHAMEHGTVVVAYHCPAGCDAEIAQIQAFLDARPADPLCVAPLTHRFILTPDPLLDVPFAAAAWGASLKSQCLDLPALGAFIDAHYALAPENFCFDGTDVTAPGSGIPADCGQPVAD